MTVTAEDYKQWHDAYWVDTQRASREVVESFKETLAALSNSDAPKFLLLTGGDAPDGLHQTTNRAESAANSAFKRLQELALSDDQRKKASKNAIGTVDEAIRELDGLGDVLTEVQAGLVRGVRLESEAVRENAAEIKTIAQSGFTNRLQDTLSAIERALTGSDQAVVALIGLPQGELVISEPVAVNMSIDRVDAAVVDKWNEQTLKTMGEGSSTAFYQVANLVIIDAQEPPGVQPFLEWAQKEADSAPDATITVLKRGGAFDPGKIKVVGAKSTSNFETAIKRVSKKKIEF